MNETVLSVLRAILAIVLGYVIALAIRQAG